MYSLQKPPNELELVIELRYYAKQMCAVEFI